MKLLLLISFFAPLSLAAVEKLDPADPKRVQEKKVIESDSKKISVLDKKPASQLCRSWVNPVQSVRRPATQLNRMQVIQPGVRQPQLEQNFSQMKEWKPARVVQVYEKSKDFEKVLNSLSLRDFNRFIYQRNPSSP